MRNHLTLLQSCLSVLVLCCFLPPSFVYAEEIQASLCPSLPSDGLVMPPSIFSLLLSGTRWGVDSQFICCTDGAYTFALTSSAITRNSTTPYCRGEADWEGWVDSSSGRQTFTWQTKGGTCKEYSGTFTYKLIRGRSYLFQAGWTGSSIEIWALSQKTGSDRPAAGESDEKEEKIVKELVVTVPLS